MLPRSSCQSGCTTNEATIHRKLDLQPQLNSPQKVPVNRAIGCFDLLKTLGRGNFATVKEAVHVFSGEHVAIKIIDQTKLDSNGKTQLLQEVRCMKLLHHPNIVRLYEIIDTPSTMYLVLDLADEGDLYDYMLKNDKAMSEKTARHYFQQIVNAVDYCHQLHVVHRDLKPENVLMFRRLRMVKLTDFGFGHLCQPGTSLEMSCGSMRYSSPEILFGKKYDGPAVDIWGLGILLYAMVCGRPPFMERNDSETVSAILDCRYMLPKTLSPSCASLIGRMLVKKPEERANLPEIRQHMWLKQIQIRSPMLNDTDYERRSSQEGIDSSSSLCRPLISHRGLCDEAHEYIVKTMLDGGVANAPEEITQALDADDYNDVTATYYLLAERLLRAENELSVADPGIEEEDELVPASLNFSSGDVDDGRSHRLNYHRRIAGQPSAKRAVDLASVAEMLEELSEDEEECTENIAPLVRTTNSPRYSPSTSRRLTSAKSSPHLQLNKISEEVNSDDIDVFSEMFSVNRERSLHNRERQITSPDRLKRIERSRRRQRSRSGSGSSQNSSDCSDTDDVSINLSKASPSRVSFVRPRPLHRRCVSMSCSQSRMYSRESSENDSPTRNASAPILFPLPKEKLASKASLTRSDKKIPVLQHSQSLVTIPGCQAGGSFSQSMDNIYKDNRRRHHGYHHRPQSLPPVPHVELLLNEQMRGLGRDVSPPNRFAIKQHC